MDSRDVLSVLRLHLATIHRADLGERLIERFGSAREVFRRARAELLAEEGMTARSLERLLAARSARRAEEEVRRTEREGVRILLRGTASYPEPLARLPEMPLVLFAWGDLVPSDERSVAVVGSRRPSPYGARQARRFARSLAGWGVSVVSGLARGVDGAAQEAAIEGGGRTLAVLGSGLGRIYPPEHRRLAERIAAGRGAVISEFPFETSPRSYHFPQRNRLISGLSALVFVVEAGERSGSLITVDWALRQGKSVYVLPGRVDQPEAIGALRLLRDGAVPALGPEELADDLGVRRPAERNGGAERERPLPGALGGELVRLFEEEDVWFADGLSERLGIDPGRLLAELARLEIEGHLRRDPAGGYALAR